MIGTEMAKSRLLPGVLLSVACFMVGTAGGAQNFATSQPTVQPAVQPAPKSAELGAADGRVEAAKAKFDNAKKVLSAAKASLKAAEAEYKAARTNRDAISLRETAQQLADASGFSATAPAVPAEPVRQMIMPPTGNRLTPVTTPVQPVPIKGTPAVDFNGAPPPSTDVAPNANNEPNTVP